MGTIKEKLDYLNETKNLMKEALIEKGQEVKEEDTFRSYVDKIKNIKGGIIRNPDGDHIYGVKHLLYSKKSYESTWIRTDDSIGLFVEPPLTTHADNPFNHYYPWRDIISYNFDAENGIVTAEYGDENYKEDGTNGQVMTYFPKFWWKRWQDEEYEYIQIATYPAEGFNYSPPFSLGRYLSSFNESLGKIESKSGALLFLKNPTIIRDYAKSLGKGWGLMDISRLALIQMLFLVRYANNISPEILGKGRLYSYSTKTGDCDSLGMQSGTTANSSSHSVIDMGLEDIYTLGGSSYSFQFIDGVNVKDYQAYVCYDRDKYKCDMFEEPYKAISYLNKKTSSTGNNMGYDEENPLIMLPTDKDSVYYKNNYCYTNSGDVTVCLNNKYRENEEANGLWAYAIGSKSSVNLMCRLMYMEE